MSSSPQLERALLLHEQGRHEMAEKELRQHLAWSPDDGFAHALLAITLAERERREEAEQAAREAIGYAPDLAYAHFALARVLSDRRRLDEASDAILEAIRLEPMDADYHGALAAIEFQRERWTEALAAAEAGLRSDPEHVTCNNLRAMALVKLGRKAEAGTTIQATLAREPENALTHANQGWTLLEQGRRKEAMTHFRESLRLDPTNDWARTGLIEAIKAGNPVYAVILKYFLWMQKLSNGARWGVLLGGYFGVRFLAGISRANPEWSPWITPVRVLYVAFALMTWLAYPIFNLMLFLHPFGRHALDREQRLQASLVGTSLAVGLGFLTLSFLSSARYDYLLPALIFGLLAIPVAAIFICEQGWPRWVMIVITLALAGSGLTAAALLSFVHPLKDSPMAQLGGAAFGVFVLGTFLSQWIANWLSTQHPQR